MEVTDNNWSFGPLVVSIKSFDPLRLAEYGFEWDFLRVSTFELIWEGVMSLNASTAAIFQSVMN